MKGKQNEGFQEKGEPGSEDSGGDKVRHDFKRLLTAVWQID